MTDERTEERRQDSCDIGNKAVYGEYIDDQLWMFCVDFRCKDPTCLKKWLAQRKTDNK